MSYLIDALLDTLKIAPFLYLTFLAVEYLEHRSQKQQTNWLKKNKKTQPLIGALTGLIPSCGMSVGATNLFCANLISLGTLIAVYLATSDEAFLYLLVSGNFSLLVKVVGTKLLFALLFGYLLDLFYHQKAEVLELNNQEHDDCDDNHFLAAFKHFYKIAIFIFLVNVVFGLLLSGGNLDVISDLILTDNFFQPLLTALIGLIPNCTISVLFTDLYLKDLISYSSFISGLLSATGTTLILLFRTSLKLSFKLKIIGILLLASTIAGISLSFFTLI